MLALNGNVHFLKYELGRFSTFGSFQEYCPISAFNFAKAGFYYTGISDEVKCLDCDFVHKGWKLGDDPLTIHNESSPNCSFLKNMDSKPSSLSLRWESHIEQNLKDTPRSDAYVYALFGRHPDAKLDNSKALLNSGVIDKDQLLHHKKTEDGCPTKEFPKYPKYTIQCVRLKTFTEKPKLTEQLQVEKWAVVGFFLEDGSDKICCFYCGIKASIESVTHLDPWSEFRLHNDQCFFFKSSEDSQSVKPLPRDSHAVEESAVADLHTRISMDHPAVVSAKKADGCSDEVLGEALNIWKQRYGCDRINAKSLLGIIWEIKDNNENNKGSDNTVYSEDNMQAYFEDRNTSDAESVESDDSGIGSDTEVHDCDDKKPIEGKTAVLENKKDKLDEDTIELIKENERLKELLLCKVCMDGEAAVVFLPCGHISTCLVCSSALHKCPVCRKLVRGRIKAIM